MEAPLRASSFHLSNELLSDLRVTGASSEEPDNLSLDEGWEGLAEGFEGVQQKSVAPPESLREKGRMTPTTILTLADLSEAPKVKLALPVLRSGDRVKLAFRLRRQNAGRSEVLDVNGEFRVASVSLSVEHQFVSVESVGKAPAWRAVRKDTSWKRPLPPARFPPTLL